MQKLTVRFEDDVYEELKKIGSLTGQSLNSVCNALVREKYNTIEGDPKVKLAFEKLNELKATLEKMNEEFKSV